MADTATERRRWGGRLAAALALAAALGVAAGGVRAQPWAGRFEHAAFQPRDRTGGYRGGEAGPRGFGPTGASGWRRGQVLPPDYRERGVADPGRYHLRAPPNGYGWVGDERNAYLMQRSTGMVLDAVPGAYEPAPRYAPREGRGRRSRR